MSRTNLIRIFCVSCALFLMPAYAQQKFADYPVHAADSYAIKAESAGLIIGVQPVEDPKEQKGYFDTELTPRGFIPVFIVIENRSREDSYLFDKSIVTCGPDEAGISHLEVRSKAERPAVVGVSMLAPAGGFIVMAKVINASHVQQNILKKELQSKTLSPLASGHGFLYIPAPKNGPRPKIHLRIPVTKLNAEKPETFVLDLVF
jgi:hypothetical protein